MPTRYSPVMKKELKHSKSQKGGVKISIKCQKDTSGATPTPQTSFAFAAAREA